MSLPKPALVLSLILLFSIFSTNVVAYAQTTNPNSPENATNNELDRSRGNREVTSSAPVASDEQGKVKAIPIAVWVVGTAIAALLFKDEIKSAVNCVQDFGECVEGAAIVSQNFVYKQSIGCDFVAPQNGRYQDDCQTQKLNAYRNGGEYGQIPNVGFFDIASGITNSSLSLPVPVEGGQYFASINPLGTVQAQSTDVASQFAESPILLEIWNKTRNGAYAFLVVVLVIIGFMIMFRRKLDPRTTVSIQNSMPKIVIAMLLITFSFAIAGLMADIVRVITILGMGLIGGPTFNLAAMVLMSVASATIITAPLALFNTTIAGIALLLLSLILIVIIFLVMISLLFKIINRYVIFILLTIFSPLFFVFGALPGAEGVVLNWFRRTAAALFAIPATAFVLQLSYVIGFAPFLDQQSANLPVPWTPIPNPIHSILQWLILGPIVGLGLFFFATKVPDIVDELFGIKELGQRKGFGPGAIVGAPVGVAQFATSASRGVQGYIGLGLPGNKWLNRRFPKLGGGGAGGAPPGKTPPVRTGPAGFAAYTSTAPGGQPGGSPTVAPGGQPGQQPGNPPSATPNSTRPNKKP